MADNDDFEDDEQETQDSPGDLRKALRKANKAIEALEAERNELRDGARKRTLSELLTEKGLSPKVSAFVPSTVEADAASLDTWLSEFGDVFGAPNANTEQTDEDQDDEDATTRQAQQRVADATAGAQSESRSQDLMTRMKNAKDQKELDEILASTPIR